MKEKLDKLDKLVNKLPSNTKKIYYTLFGRKHSGVNEINIDFVIKRVEHSF